MRNADQFSKLNRERSDVYLIAGLGNPGIFHRKNRHNAGVMLVDRIAGDAGGKFRNFSSLSRICRINLAGKPVILLKPRTYMNRSGRSVRELVDYFDIELSNCLIAYDEIALPLGRIRFRSQGSSGGHRGMQSVIEALGTTEIARLRIGILGESKPKDLAGYVLSSFSRRERELLSSVLDDSADGILHFITHGIGPTMSFYNREGRVPD